MRRVAFNCQSAVTVEMRRRGCGLFLLVTPAAVLLAFVARPFLSLWAGPQYGAHSTAPFLVAVIGVWFDCLAFMPTSYLLSSGRTKMIAYIRAAQLVPYLVAAWILTDRFGVIGAAFAWSGGVCAGFRAVVRRGATGCVVAVPAVFGPAAALSRRAPAA